MSVDIVTDEVLVAAVAVGAAAAGGGEVAELVGGSARATDDPPIPTHASAPRISRMIIPRFYSMMHTGLAGEPVRDIATLNHGAQITQIGAARRDVNLLN